MEFKRKGLSQIVMLRIEGREEVMDGPRKEIDSTASLGNEWNFHFSIEFPAHVNVECPQSRPNVDRIAYASAEALDGACCEQTHC